RIIREIQSREQVHINVPNENWEYIVRSQLKGHGCPTRNVFFHYIKTNESWCRDHGPAFVLRVRPGKYRATMKQRCKLPQEAAIIDWGFNGWGGKYPPFDDDDRVPTEIAKELDLPVFYPRAGNRAVVMEGGAVDFNGAGTVMTTTQCLLNKN